MKNLRSYLFLPAFMFIYTAVHAQTIDKDATEETKNLLHKVKMCQQTGIMFGHQDDLAYGVGWKYEAGRSDIKDITGEYPAVYGWELGLLEVDAPDNLDGVPFKKMRQYIQEGYNRGGLITISWHLNNPLTGKSAWDSAPGTVESILPGGKRNDIYKAWLDKVAAFMLDLRGKQGEYIPVIFRPFHELNGSWFWWGKNHCSPEQIKELYRFTVNYLRDIKNVHNLLYAFNTDRFSSREEYLERYPGNDYVDIIGFDIYQKGDILGNSQFIKELDQSLTLLEEIATANNKIPALTEFGYNAIPQSNWWTTVFYKAIEKHSIAYVLAWRNAGQKPTGEIEYFVPYKGQVSAADFKKFSSFQKIFLEKKTRQQNLYKKP